MEREASAQASITDLCDLLGRREIARRVARGVTAVGNAVADGKFPASWYLAIKLMCDERGVECPLQLFRFIDLEPPPPTEKDVA